MLLNTQSQTIPLPNGDTIKLETGKLAGQAHGSALVTQGKAMLLATVVGEKQSENPGFLPLSVDYQEKYAAAGKIPGGFLRREGKMTDHEVLVSRLIDRAIRPCFPDNYYDSIQVRVMLLSADENISPDPLAALAASAALTLSPLPFYEPIAQARVGRIKGEMTINPSPQLLETSDMDIIVAASHDRVLMIEGAMREVGEEDLLAAIAFAHEAIKTQCKAQKALAQAVGVSKEEAPETLSPVNETYTKAFYEPLYAVACQALPSKAERKKAFKQVYEGYIATLGDDLTESEEATIKAAFKEIQYAVLRDLVLKEHQRIDGRQPNTIRPITAEVNVLPAAHGSSLFTRGETQVLTSLTLGSKQDEQLIDGVTKSGYNKVMLHYDFPPFSTGEVKPSRGPSRREIGHGKLALRGLRAVLPSEEDNPYTMRLHSIVLSSNGSSSMATECSCSLALMDAGINIRKTVAGIAMGLISDSHSGANVILSDILGEEDQIGDMDFKVTGTKDGLTACQMDIKVAGISHELLSKALQQAKQGIHHIIGVMEKVIQEPIKQLKAHAPRVETLKIPRNTIGAVIGPGGKVIQELQRNTGATISVSEENDLGIVHVLAPDKESLDQAITTIRGITTGPEVGKVYSGKVKSVQKYGAFVEFITGTDGLLHISEVSHERITEEQLREKLLVGQEIRVKLIEAKGGKYSLTTKIEESKAETTQDTNNN